MYICMCVCVKVKYVKMYENMNAIIITVNLK